MKDNANFQVNKVLADKTKKKNAKGVLNSTSLSG
jgi:hypothetical protein